MLQQVQKYNNNNKYRTENWPRSWFDQTCISNLPVLGSQAVGLYCSWLAAPASKGNFQKTCYETFGTSGHPSQYAASVRLFPSTQDPTKTGPPCIRIPRLRRNRWNGFNETSHRRSDNILD